MDDCRRISRRVVLASAAFSFGAAAAATVVSRTAAQQKLSQGDAKYSDCAEGRPALRGLRQLPSSEWMQIRPRRHQPERLVPAVCREVLTAKCVFRGAPTAPAFPSGRSSASKQANSL